MSLSNTNQRILSAIVLVSLLGVVIYAGGIVLEYFIVILSLLLLDELLGNVLELKRFSWKYLISQCFFLVASFIGFHYLSGDYLNMIIVILGLPLVFGAFWFLFFPHNLLKVMPFLKRKNYLIFFTTLAVWVFWGGLYSIFQYQLWVNLLAVIFVTTYATDSFAWLIGKNWGKTPLWPEVSPKKTLEGAIGGYICGAFIGGFLWYLLIEAYISYSLCAVMLLPIIAQLGDLSQSRVKRWVGIKDSSNLIPGHGGIFDRVDSLMLVLPFYVGIIWRHYV